ncbi:MAG TPA: recombinase family protein [Rubrobacteraceae bacterium]|nr:recombinase family protein [Rubrobacteraceae bacterium]
MYYNAHVSCLALRLDRRGRSLHHLIDTVTELQEKGIGFKSLTESIDTTTSGGRLVFNIFASLAGLSGRFSGSEHKQGFSLPGPEGKSVVSQKHSQRVAVMLRRVSSKH